MKLIIEIDDELVETARFAVRLDMGDDYVKSITNGIPLDDVFDKIRSEIEALPKTYPFINHIDTYVKEDDVKKIIDRYMEGVQE